MRLSVEPILSQSTVAQAADQILLPQNTGMLSLPVVDEHGKVLGDISRHQLNNIFMRRFGRELYGARRITQVMNTEPLVVEMSASLEAAAEYVTANIRSPLTEDFILVENGIYSGMGVVLGLLRALQERVAASATRLSDAYGQLKASQAQLVQSEKMASLGQMVAGVAHEINTPLGYVRNNVDMMKSVYFTMRDVMAEQEKLGHLLVDEGADEATLSAQMAKASALMNDLRDSKTLEDTEPLIDDTMFGIDQIKELVLNLKNFSRLDSARTSEANLNDCLDQTLSIAASVLKGTVEVIKRYGDIPLVRCSPSQINQVLLNIITNSAQAIEHKEGKLQLKTEYSDGLVHVSIQDNGKGIAAENLAKIFDPFFTTKPIGQGTGLGLSISFQIVRAHGGTLKVASEVGKGTRFMLSLPLQSVEPNSVPTKPAPEMTAALA